MPREQFGWGREEWTDRKNLYSEEIEHEANLRKFGEEKFSRPPAQEPNPIEDALRQLMPFDKGWDFTYAEKVVYGKVLQRGPQNIGNCWVEGTLVQLADGTYRAIESLQLHDKVLTAEGNGGFVQQLGVREVEEEVIEVQPWGHHGVTCTANHKVLTARGYVEAGDLRSSDRIAMPKHYFAEDRCRIFPRQIIAAEVRQFARNDRQVARQVTRSVGVYERRPSSWTSYPVPEQIELTPKFGRLLGLFLAEGSTDSHRVIFSYAGSERDTLAAETMSLFRELFDVEATLYQKTGKNVCNVRVHGKQWALLFESLCGRLSSGKRLSERVANGPSDFLSAILSGWLSGDGYTRRGTIQGVTVSHVLALQMARIATALGKMPTIRRTQPSPSHGVKARRERWDVTFQEEVQNHWRAEQDEQHVWRKVRSLTSRMYRGCVYNLTVPGDHSYTVEGIGSKNCVGYSHCLLLATRVAHEILVEGDPEEKLGDAGTNSPVPYIPYSYGAGRCLSGNMCGGGDGSYCSVQMRASMEHGFLPSDTPGLTGDVPQGSSRTGRAWGSNRSILNEWRPKAVQFDLEHSYKCQSEDDVWTAIVEDHHPVQICSGWGFKPVRQVGWDDFKFWEHKRGGSWAHSMQILAAMESPSGERWYKIGNQWGDYHRDGWWFMVSADTMRSWISSADARTTGEIKGRPSFIGFP